MIGVVASLICVARVKYTGFWLYGLRIYGLFGFILVIWSMINQILVLNFSDKWSFRLYGQLYQDKTVDHISETRCTFYCIKKSMSLR